MVCSSFHVCWSKHVKESSPLHLFCAEWVSGSPRSSNYFGQVFVYNYNEATTSASDGQIFQQFAAPSIVLTGQQVRQSLTLCFCFYMCHTCTYMCVCTSVCICMCACMPSCHFSVVNRLEPTLATVLRQLISMVTGESPSDSVLLYAVCIFSVPVASH